MCVCVCMCVCVRARACVCVRAGGRRAAKTRFLRIERPAEAGAERADAGEWAGRCGENFIISAIRARKYFFANLCSFRHLFIFALIPNSAGV